MFSPVLLFDSRNPPGMVAYLCMRMDQHETFRKISVLSTLPSTNPFGEIAEVSANQRLFFAEFSKRLHGMISQYAKTIQRSFGLEHRDGLRLSD